jgi:hypothetical protein
MIMARHFFKVLTIFLALIILGLIGVYIVDRLDKNGDSILPPDNQMQVAK